MNDPALAPTARAISARCSPTASGSGAVKKAITSPGNAPAKSLRVALHCRSPSWTSARNATFGLKSKQFFVHPTQGWQCEFGTFANGVWP